MSQITLEFPDESLLALKLTPEAFGAEIRMVAAVKLFELRVCEKNLDVRVQRA